MSNPSTVLPGFPRSQLVVRGVLTLSMGLALLALHSATWLGLTCAVALLLFADGAVAVLYHPAGPGGDHPAATWLTPVWQINTVLTAATLLALVFRPSRLAVTVTVVMAALTGGFWLAAYRLSSGTTRWAILGWMGVPFLMEGVLRVMPALTSAPNAFIDVRWLGAVDVVVGLLILWWSSPPHRTQRG